MNGLPTLIETFNNSSYCSYNTYHIYPVLVEDRGVCFYLDNMGIQNGIHYPIAIEKMPFLKNISLRILRLWNIVESWSVADSSFYA